jgi:hypothetical protein
MKNVLFVLALLAVGFSSNSAHAGIIGHRRPQPSGGYYYYPQQSAAPAQQPSNLVQRPGTYVQPPVSQVQPPARYVQQPAPVYRSYSQQPRSNPFPFDSRADPRDWKEAHRGYGVKIRGW